MHQEVRPKDFYDAWQEIERMRYYFYKFAGPNADEAMARTLMHVITHFDANKGYLPDYVRKLARTIEKKNNKLVLVDFLEDTVYEDDIEDTNASIYASKKRVTDVADEAIENVMQKENYYKDIQKLALEFMDKFVLLSKALIQHDTNTTYYPEPFIKACMDLMHKYNNFNQACIDIYTENDENFQWFLSLDNNDTEWRETDYLLFAQRESKRVLLINKVTKEVVKDCENEKFGIQGNLGTKANPKYVLKVDFSKAWHTMCDLIDDSYCNEMKFVLGDNYIIRTLGGSYSVVNPIKTNMYNLVRDEIVTNILLMFNCRLLSVGKTTAYILANDIDICKDYLLEIKGVNIEFNITQPQKLTKIQ